MEIVGLTALIAIIWKVVDFLKYLTNRYLNAAVTQATVWVAALAARVTVNRTLAPLSIVDGVISKRRRSSDGVNGTG